MIRAWRPWAVVGVACALLVACSDELPPLPDQGVPNDQRVVDQAQPADSTVDGQRRDMPTPPADSTLDVGQPPDATLDVPPPPLDLPVVPTDSTVDVRSPDMTRDTRSPDITYDTRAPDTSVDLVSPPNLTVTLAPVISPIGWYDAAGQSTIVILSPSPQAGLTYECRIAPGTVPASAAWLPCDGANGNTPVVQPPNSGSVSGTYAVQVRARWGHLIGGVAVRTFYVHSTLNRVPLCSPQHDDSLYFNAARSYINLMGTFSTTANLSGPFINFVVTASGTQYFVDILSLRRQFRFDANRQLLLITRRYQSRMHGSCKPGITMDVRWPVPSPSSTWFFDQANQRCDALVLNAAGVGICFSDVATGVSTYTPTVIPKAYRILIDHVDRLPFSRKSRNNPPPQHHIYLPN